MRKNWIKRGLMASSITRLVGRFNGKGVVILMYHSVMDEPGRESSTLGGIIHSTAVFRRQMELIAREYMPVTLDDVLFFVRGEKELPPRAVVVTFDDGYADNHEVAVPILDRVGVPATFYIIADCVETAKLPWPSRLRYAFFTSKESWWKQDKTIWSLGDLEKRDRAFLHACDLCATLAGETQEAFVRRIDGELNVEAVKPTKRLMMTWGQARDLVKKGYIVGSHTMTHPNMAYIAAADATRELKESKRKLEAALNSPTIHFSYPCPALSPHWNERTREISLDVGYQTAVTTNGGMVRRQDDPLSLRRIPPTKDVDGLRWNLECTFLRRKV